MIDPSSGKQNAVTFKVKMVFSCNYIDYSLRLRETDKEGEREEGEEEERVIGKCEETER